MRNIVSLGFKIIEKLSFFLLIVIFSTGCENEIDLNLPQPESQLVVEGWIEQTSQLKYCFL
jgi:hypothetical protein